jgi:membrane fusion protein, heavy metal efflux system
VWSYLQWPRYRSSERKPLGWWVALACAGLLGSACDRHTPGPAEKAGPKPAEQREQHEHADEHEGGEQHEHGEEHEKSGGKHAEHHELTRRVRVSDAVARDARLVVVPVKREALAETLVLPGEVAGDPDRLARISSPAAGRIEEVRLREGAVVKKGDVLVVLRVPEITRVRGAYAATKARAAAARVNQERLQRLAAEGISTQQAVLDAAAEADALEAEAGALGLELGALGAASNGALAISLRAPLTGIVVSRDAVVGQPVAPEQTLATIAALDEVWFLGRVFEKDLGRVRLGARAEVRLNAYAGERFTGTVEYLGQAVDPVGRTITARIRLKNRAEMLRIGLFGSAEVALPNPRGAQLGLVVPRSAVTEVGGKSVVFVKLPSGEFELHEVTLGAESVGSVEVLGGLGEGELVASEGVFTLKSLVLKDSFAESGHGH